MTFEQALQGIRTGKYPVLGTPGEEKIGLPATLLRVSKVESMRVA